MRNRRCNRPLQQLNCEFLLFVASAMVFPITTEWRNGAPTGARYKHHNSFTEEACREVAGQIGAVRAVIRYGPHAFTFVDGKDQPDEWHITAIFHFSDGRWTVYHIFTSDETKRYQLKYYGEKVAIKSADDFNAERDLTRRQRLPVRARSTSPWDRSSSSPSPPPSRSSLGSSSPTSDDSGSGSDSDARPCPISRRDWRQPQPEWRQQQPVQPPPSQAKQSQHFASADKLRRLSRRR